MKKIHNDATLSLRLPSSLEKKLDTIAEQKSIAVGSLCRMILSEWVQQNAGTLLVDAVTKKPSRAITPPSKRPVMTREDMEEERRQLAWVASLGGGEEETKKEVDYGDDW